MTLDRIARMVADGIEEVKTVVKEDIGGLRVEMKGLRVEMNSKFSKLEYQIDEIKEIVERFEKSDILNLQKRVQMLERAVKVLSKQV